MHFFDLGVFVSIHCYLCKKGCIKTANGLNANATNILFIMSVMRFSCSHVHNICAKLFFFLNEYRSRKVFAKIMQYIYNNHLSADGK